ncbi:MAG: tandem-95 repeat protein [Thermoplasmata archaeon]|nr:tandem-95 repeat protein [Thermoplasmata archaeon]
MNPRRNVSVVVSIMIVCVLVGMPLYAMVFNAISSQNSEILQEEVNEISGLTTEIVMLDTVVLETVEDYSIVLEVNEMFGSSWDSIEISESQNFFSGWDKNYVYICPNSDWNGKEELTVTASYLFSPIPAVPPSLPGIDLVDDEETVTAEEVLWEVIAPLSVTVLPMNDEPVTVMEKAYAIEMSTNTNMEMNEAIYLPAFFQDVDNELSYSWMSGNSLITPVIEDDFITSFKSSGAAGEDYITLMAYDGEFVATYDFCTFVNQREPLSFMEDSCYDFNFNEYVDTETQSFEVIDSEHLLFEDYSEVMAIVPEGDWYGDETVSILTYPKPMTRPPLAPPTLNVVDPISIDPPTYEFDMVFGLYEFDVSISNVNDPPVISSSPAVLLNEDDISIEAFNIDDLFYDIDSQLSYEVESQNSKLSLELGTDGSLDMTPMENWFGTENVMISATDGEYVISQGVTVQVAPINDVPLASGESLTLEIDEDTNVTIDLDDYVSDVDDALWFDILCTNTNVTITTNETTWETTIEPLDNWNGQLDLVVYASDDEYQLARNLILNVNAVNDAPTIISSAEQKFNEDQYLELDLNEFFQDVDNEMSFITYSGDSALKCEQSENNRLRISSSADNWNGQAAITMVATDGVYIVEQDIVVNVIPVNDAPTARSADKELRMNEDTSLSLELNDMFQDIDMDELTYEFSTGDQLQLVYDNEDILELYPTENWHGSLFLHIMASDGEATATRSLNIVVEPVNDSPTLCASVEPVLAAPGETVSIDLSMYFSDIDTSNMDFEVFGYENVMVAETSVPGKFLLTLPENWEGTEIIGVRASDGVDTVESEMYVSSIPVSPEVIIQTASPASPLQSMFWLGVGILAAVVSMAAVGRTRQRHAGKRAPAGNDSIF